MTITDIILETISDIAAERKIEEDSVTWQDIAIELTKKLKNEINENKERD